MVSYENRITGIRAYDDLKNLSVLFCGPHAEYVSKSGGYVHYCTNLPANIAGYLKRVISLVPSNGKPELIVKDDHYNIYLMGGSENRNRSLNYMKYAIKMRKEYDLVHFNAIIPAYFYLSVKKILRKPYVLTVHGYPSLEGILHGKYTEKSLKFRIVRHIEKAAVKNADAVIAVGKTIREWIINVLGAERDKVFYIPNGVDVNMFKPQKFSKSEISNKDIIKKHQIFKNKNIIIYDKGILEVNGIRTLLLSIPIIIKKHPHIILLVLGEGPLTGDMKLLAKKLNIERNVMFLGRVKNQEIPYFLNMSDIHCVPFQPPNPHTKFGVGDTLGISHLEAMASGLPTIGTKTTVKEGTFEFEMKRSIVVVRPKDPVGLARAILYLLEHPEEAREMGKRAREYVLKNYTWDITAKKTLEVYRYALTHSN